jgi:cell division protein FtsZ
MRHAGSALMGIGRASGENRAVLAAQQAIESPLLEVSIDGARGVLFNIAGGYDMSMHEINEAAEVITNAVASDANIIFGATLKPDLEEELVITVIATGFDSAYFHARENGAEETDEEPEAKDDVEEVADEEISNIDMDVDKKHEESTFTADEEPKNIWNYDDESDTPAFLRRRKKIDEEA